jgi:hypothetical protein
MADHIKTHAGVGSIQSSRATKNFLILFDQNEITPQEIILRAGLSLSIDFDMTPVRIRIQKKEHSISNLSALSFALIAANHGWRLLSTRSSGSGRFQVLAGATTLVAVVEHVIQDFRGKGNFHPEVFSVYYLLLSFLKKDILKGSTITWFLTFGRHLMELPASALILIPEKKDPHCDIHQCEYEVTVRKEQSSNWFSKMMQTIPNTLLKAYKEMNLGLSIEEAFFQQMGNVADAHDDIIEGLEDIDHGFYLKVEK